MNIDVTAIGGNGTFPTWSEKFCNVARPEEVDGKLKIFRVNQKLKDKFGDAPRHLIAEFAPGAWHSWRQVKD